MNKTTFLLNPRSFLIGAVLVSLACLAQAQWSWRDASGSRVFSDQPPPPGVAEKNILKRPPSSKTPEASAQTSGEVAASTPVPTSTSSPAPTLTLAPKASGKDAELEKKKKENESKEAAKKQADAEKTVAAKKDNCDRAKRSKAGLDSGVRIAAPNAKGEREIMNDEQRSSETKRMQEIIASECA